MQGLDPWPTPLTTCAVGIGSICVCNTFQGGGQRLGQTPDSCLHQILRPTPNLASQSAQKLTSTFDQEKLEIVKLLKQQPTSFLIGAKATPTTEADRITSRCSVAGSVHPIYHQNKLVRRYVMFLAVLHQQ